MMDKYAFTLESYKNIQELIRFTDQKSGGVIVVAGLELTVFLNFIDKLGFNKDYTSLASVAVFLFGIITAILLAITIYISIFKVVRPRLANQYNAYEISLFYFNHLASAKNKTVMFNQFNNVTNDSILRNLTDQIFEVSKIMTAKTNGLYYSMTTLLYSMLTLSLFILVSKFL
jgi:hypothetical protein